MKFAEGDKVKVLYYDNLAKQGIDMSHGPQMWAGTAVVTDVWEGDPDDPDPIFQRDNYGVLMDNEWQMQGAFPEEDLEAV